jgi:hypothetical protein
MKRVFKKAFIPHEGNDFRPHALRAKTVVPVVAVLVVLQIALWWASPLIPRSRLFGIIEVSALTDGTNEARAAQDVSMLQMSPLLQAAAQEKANDMVANNYFAHTSPQGLSPWYWFSKVGYSFSYAGENLAVNFSDSGDVTTAWLNSPEHRENILDPHFTQIGMAVAQGTFQGHSATYVVELFGAPSAAAAPVAQAPFSPSKVESGEGIAQTPAIKTTSMLVSIPAVVATNPATGTEPISVAVKGAETQALPAAGLAPVTSTTQPSPAPAVSPTTPAAPAVSRVEPPQANFIQRAFVNPTQTMDNIYYLILLFFVIALGLNIFMKIRVQHPDLILGGLVAISLAGIFILVNQQAILQVVIK